MKRVKKFYNPENLTEALSLLSRTESGIFPLGGGTSLSISKDKKIEELVSLDGIGLNYIEEEKTHYIIGAMTRPQDIVDSSLLRGTTGNILKKSAESMGSQQIRNAVTLGGNICGLLPWSDFPVALLAFDAEISLESINGERKIKAIEFFSKHPSQNLKKGEICTKISFPKLNKDCRGKFIKFARTNFDKTIMNACVTFSIKRNSLSELKIAASGCIALPSRLYELEKKLSAQPINKNLSEKIMEETSRIKEKLNFIEDSRATKKYRKKIFEVIIHDAIMEAIKHRA